MTNAYQRYVTTTSRNQFFPLVLLVFLSVVALAAVQPFYFFASPVIFKVAAAIFLLFLAPGLLITENLLSTAHLVERVLLSVGLSTAITVITLYASAMILNKMTASTMIFTLATTLGILLLGALLWRWFRWGQVVQGTIHGRALLGLCAVMAVALVLRLPNLGYAELQDDEIDVGNAAVRIIRGDIDSILRDRRGPAQPLLTAAMMHLTNSLQEWLLRLPSVIANVTTIALIWLLLYWIFDWQRATVAGIFLALDGFFLAYARVVQMQSTMLLMMALSAYLVYRFHSHRAASPSQANVYLMAGAVATGVGFLAHHEMLIFTPVLLWLLIKPAASALNASSAAISYKPILYKPVVWLSLSLFAVIIGSYYIPFVLHKNFGSTLSYYNDDIVGRDVTSNLRKYFLIGTFYNSVLYFVCIWGFVCIALFDLMGQKLSKSGWLLGLGRVLLSGAILYTIITMLGWWDAPVLGIVLWGGVLCLLLAGSGRTPSATVFCLWLFLFFLPYSFILQELHVHYYVYSIPAAVLATLGLFRSSGWVRNIMPQKLPMHRMIRAGAALGATAVCFICGLYLWLVFIQPTPAYALSFPNNQSALFPTPYQSRHGEAFGFPHKSGWKTIGHLYQTGQLRGNYETNELYLKAHWYTRDTLDTADPRYYFVSTQPHRLQSAPSPLPLTDLYNHWGDVVIGDEVGMRIYEHERFGAVDTIHTFNASDYDVLYDRQRSTTTISLLNDFQADDHFYRDLANYAEEQIATDDSAALLFYVPEQQELLSYYYQKDLPYIPLQINNLEEIEDQLSTLITERTSQFAQVHLLLWAENRTIPPAKIEAWLNGHLYKMSEQWFGNVRLLSYDIPVEPINVDNINHPLNLTLDSKLTLLGYNLAEPLRLTLFWQATEQIDTRYKVFVHLLDEDGQVIAQNDSEPVGGLRPTDSWDFSQKEIIPDNYGLVPSEENALQKYTLAVGMYNPETGQRLPLVDSSGQRLQDDMARISVSR